MFLGIAEVFVAAFEGPIRHAIPVIIPADPEQYFPVMQDDPVGLPDAHAAIINMIGLCATTVEFKDQEILSLLQVFDRCCFNVIAAIEELIGIMT